MQLAVFAREFDDVIRFPRPPRLVQRLFGLLAPLARLLGCRGSYPEYLARGTRFASDAAGAVGRGRLLRGLDGHPTTRCAIIRCHHRLSPRKIVVDC